MKKSIILLALTLLLVVLPSNPHPVTVRAATTAPLLFGWGGILAVGAIHYTSSNPSSAVFSGEQASNTEVTFAEMRSRGYNAARVSIVDPAIGGDAASYSSQAWHRTLQLAAYYGIMVIGDDHDYDCPSTSFWQPIFQDTPQSSYPNVLWETKNEPHCNTLTTDDQAIINLARNAGDTRWFVLGCNNDCSPSGGGSDLGSFPIVTDPVDHVFYDFHEYFFYSSDHSRDWTTSAAQAFADQKFQGALDVQSSLGRPFIGTEFGADTGCGDPTYGCPPDQVIPGSAGWAPETLSYLSRLVSDLQRAGLGYTVWNAGDWDDGPVGVTGAMDSPSFGSQLPLPPNLPTNTTLSPTFNFTPNNPTTGQTVSFTGSASGGTAPYVFSWSFGDGGTANGVTVTHTYNSQGSFNVILALMDNASQTAVASRIVPVSAASSTCTRADFDGDGKVTVLDLSIFALHFGTQQGQSGYNSVYDLNGDGRIDILDLVLFAIVYGQVC